MSGTRPRFTPEAGKQLVYGQLGGDSRVHVLSDGIHVSDEAVLDRVHLGLLSSGDYGLQVTNPGGTVIIDGSSDIFRIAATGTISQAGPNGTPGTPASVEVTTDIATGFTYAPAMNCYLDLAVANRAYGLPFTNYGADGTGVDQLAFYSRVVNTNQTRVAFNWMSRANMTAVTYTMRYFILEQVAF